MKFVFAISSFVLVLSSFSSHIQGKSLYAEFISVCNDERGDNKGNKYSPIYFHRHITR